MSKGGKNNDKPNGVIDSVKDSRQDKRRIQVTTVKFHWILRQLIQQTTIKGLIHVRANKHYPDESTNLHCWMKFMQI